MFSRYQSSEQFRSVLSGVSREVLQAMVMKLITENKEFKQRQQEALRSFRRMPRF